MLTGGYRGDKGTTHLAMPNKYSSRSREKISGVAARAGAARERSPCIPQHSSRDGSLGYVL